MVLLFFAVAIQPIGKLSYYTLAHSSERWINPLKKPPDTMYQRAFKSFDI